MKTFFIRFVKSKKDHAVHNVEFRVDAVDGPNAVRIAMDALIGSDGLFFVLDGLKCTYEDVRAVPE